VLDGASITLAMRGGRLWPRSVDAADGRIAIGSFGASPIILSLDQLQVTNAGGPDTYGPNALATSRGELAIGLDSGLVISVPLSSISTGRTFGAKTYEVATDPILSLASVAGRWLAGTYAGSVVRLDTTSGDGPITSGLDLGASVPSLAAHLDGTTVIAGTYDGRIAYLDVTDSIKLQSARQVHEGSVKSLQWLSPTRAISGATDCSVRLLDQDGSDSVLWYHGNLVNAVTSDHRGLVASASRDRLVRAGVVTNEKFRSIDLLGADESMKAVAVLGEGDDAWIIGGSYDFGVYLWRLDLADDSLPDARSGTVLFQADQAISTILALNPRAAIVASWDGTVRLLELREGRPIVGPPVRVDELVAVAPAEATRHSEIGTPVVA
jgi:toxoflavin biosynthesis protein ToxC